MRAGAAEAVINPVDTGSSVWAEGALVGRAARVSAGNGAGPGTGLFAASGVTATVGSPTPDATAAGAGGTSAPLGATDNGATTDNGGTATDVDSGGATTAGVSGLTIGTIAGAGASLIGESRMRGGAAMFSDDQHCENKAGSARKQAFAGGKNSHAPPARAYAISPPRTPSSAGWRAPRPSAPNRPGSLRDLHPLGTSPLNDGPSGQRTTWACRRIRIRYELSIHPCTLIRSLALAAVLFPLTSPAVASPPPPGAPDANTRRLTTATEIREAVAAALSTGPVGADLSGVTLLAASLSGSRVTLNFSRHVLDLGPGSLRFEAFFARVHRAASDVVPADLRAFEIQTEIEGLPLDRWFPPATRVGPPSIARQLIPSPLPVAPAPQPLAGRRIALSPGHGYYLVSGTNYVLQRSYFSGIVEDFVNHDIISALNTLLVEAGADVRPTRNLDRTAGVGETGFPRWQEAARYHVKALGADASVWNESGFTHLEQDIRCRPRYANAVGAELLVSVHNNGGGGTGTETLYDTANGFGPESKRLADLLHAKVITAIRRDYNAAWADRRVQGFNGSYGENRLATRPAVILEIAFMDRPTPDNAALQDGRFKLLVATAIRDGIREFLDGPAPAAPATLIATAESNAISLAWVDTATNESGFLLERKIDAAPTWTTLATLAANTVSFRDATATSGTLAYVYRVSAFNSGGSSAGYSNEATATLLAPPVTLLLAAVTPATIQTRDWNQTADFTLTVTDASGAPVTGAALVVRDLLRNTGETLFASTADATGRLTYRTTVPTGQTDGSYAITFQATKSGATSSAVVTREVVVAHAPVVADGAPTIVTQPLAQTVIAGTPVSFVVNTASSGSTSHSYQWHFNGSPLTGTTRPAFTLPAVTAAQAGAYSVVVTTPAGSVTSLAAQLKVNPAAWLSNVSLRTTLASGQNVIVGFVVGGDGSPKDLLLRAAGPALAGFGLTGAMTDPRLELYRDSTKLTDNNDWPAALAPSFAAVGAFPFAAASRDAALQRSFVGAHTVQVTGTSGGVVLVEGYDAGPGSAARLVNLSARNRVGTGADILIAGFYVAGAGSQRVLIRAVGPTLAALGVSSVLADPQLEVTDATGRLASNDNWDAALAPVFAQVGAFPLPVGSKDSAVVVTLAAGRSYTVQVSGVAATVGEALVEVYEVP